MHCKTCLKLEHNFTACKGQIHPNNKFYRLCTHFTIIFVITTLIFLFHAHVLAQKQSTILAIGGGEHESATGEHEAHNSKVTTKASIAIPMRATTIGPTAKNASVNIAIGNLNQKWKIKHSGPLFQPLLE